jgi:hypothetical protein
LPQPGLAATALSVTSGALTTSDTLTIDVAQTGLSFAGGQASVNLTVGGLTGGAGPVTLTAFGPGGTPMFAHTFTAPDGVTSAAIPVGPITNEVAQFKVTFSGSGQSVNAIISITGTAPTNNMSDLTQPGSVIIFPKFINLPAVHVDSGILPPASQSASCVPLASRVGIKRQGAFTSARPTKRQLNIAKSGLDLLSIDGARLPADGTIVFTTNQPRVTPPCDRGYLITGWLISQSPIKSTSIGSLIPQWRSNRLADRPGAVSVPSALQIQADPLAKVLISTTQQSLTGQGQLFFDGLPALPMDTGEGGM